MNDKNFTFWYREVITPIKNKCNLTDKQVVDVLENITILNDAWNWNDIESLLERLKRML